MKRLVTLTAMLVIGAAALFLSPAKKPTPVIPAKEATVSTVSTMAQLNNILQANQADADQACAYFTITLNSGYSGYTTFNGDTPLSPNIPSKYNPGDYFYSTYLGGCVPDINHILNATLKGWRYDRGCDCYEGSLTVHITMGVGCESQSCQLGGTTDQNCTYAQPNYTPISAYCPCSGGGGY